MYRGISLYLCMGAWLGRLLSCGVDNFVNTGHLYISAHRYIVKYVTSYTHRVTNSPPRCTCTLANHQRHMYHINRLPVFDEMMKRNGETKWWTKRRNRRAIIRILVTDRTHIYISENGQRYGHWKVQDWEVQAISCIYNPYIIWIL